MVVRLSFLLSTTWPSVMCAMAGGIVLSLGNLSTLYAWAFVGPSVVEVITSSIKVVIGILHHLALILAFVNSLIMHIESGYLCLSHLSSFSA